MFGVDFVDLFPSLVFLDYIHPFNICYKAVLVVLNSPNFCLSKKLFIFPSILSEILARDSNLGCRFFPFSTLNISCYSVLACRVSAGRSAAKHMGFPLYVPCYFPLAAFIFIFFNLNLFILIGGWLLYNIVLVLSYINMNPPWVYTCSPSWTPLPPPSPYSFFVFSLC